MTPKISVIVPFYKVPYLRLRKCIDSLQRQTMSDFELLLICDGNETEFKDFLGEYEKEDARIHAFYLKRGGVGAARNFGIEHAQGEYIAFVDSDDFVDECYLQKLVEGMLEADLAVCGVCEQFFWVAGGVFDRRVFLSLPTFFNGLQYINFSVNKMYRLDLLREHQIRFDTDVKLGEDALFLAKYYKHCRRICSIPDLMYHYVPNDKSAIHHYREAYWDWEKQVIEAQWEMFHQYPLVARQENGMTCWLYHKFRGACYYYMEHMKDKAALRAKLDEITAHPLFARLLKGDTGKKNEHFNRNERIILRLWKCFGVRGIYLTKKIKDIHGR